jgi:TPR repeat protein
MFERGQGVQVDLVAAYVWLGLAAAAGDAQAVGKLSRLASRLSPPELAEAEAAIAAWRPLR